MKIALVSCVWGRVPLTAIWWQAAQRLTSQFATHKMQAQVFVAGSESAHSKLCAQYAGQWVEASNLRVGAKWNASAQAALAWGADYILILGSDDFVSPGLGEVYAGFAKIRSHYVAMNSIVVHDTLSGETLLVDASRKRPTTNAAGCALATVVNIDDKFVPRDANLTNNITMWKKSAIGAGRFLSAHLFHDCITQHFWDPDKNRGLDASLEKNLNLPKPLLLASKKSAFLVDVKTETNIWPLDSLKEHFPESTLDDISFLSALPEFAAIRSLSHHP